MIGLMAMMNMLTSLLAGPLFAINFLFADIEEIITVVIFLVIGAISAISQYLTKKKEEAARQRRLQRQAQMEAEDLEAKLRAPEPPRELDAQRPFGRQPQRPQPKPADAPVNQNVAEEIRDFLERAATGQPAGQAPGVPKPVPPIVAVPIEDAPRSLADRPAHHSSLERRPVPTSHQAERPVEAKPVPKQHSLTNQDRRREEAIRAKKQAEAKRRQAEAARANAGRSSEPDTKFDHKLGSLKARSHHFNTEATTNVTPDSMAADVAAMFANTENIRHAIVINEILTRPTHRWE